MRGRKLPDSERIEPTGSDGRRRWVRRWFWLLVVAVLVFLAALMVVSDRMPLPGSGDEALLGEPVPHGPPADATPP